MKKAKVFYFLLITIFFLHSKVYSQEIEFLSHTIIGGELTVDGASSVYSVDVDGDGDMDVLSASYLDDKIAWYENDGDENFTDHIITTSADGAFSVYSVDVDDDGDMDVLSASYYDDKIAWYENLQITGINEYNYLILKLDDFKNYPNPFNPTTTISFSLQDNSNVELSIYNIKGQKVENLINEIIPAGEHSIVWNGKDSNGNRVSSGIYLYRLQTGSEKQVRKMLLLK